MQPVFDAQSCANTSWTSLGHSIESFHHASFALAFYSPAKPEVKADQFVSASSTSSSANPNGAALLAPCNADSVCASNCCHNALAPDLLFRCEEAAVCAEKGHPTLTVSGLKLGESCSGVGCASGCCSSIGSADPTKTVCVEATVCSARNQGDWWVSKRASAIASAGILSDTPLASNPQDILRLGPLLRLGMLHHQTLRRRPPQVPPKRRRSLLQRTSPVPW